MKQYIATTSEPPFKRAGNRPRWFTATQKSQVYDVIVASGTNGATRTTIANAVGLAPDRISFYLSDLRRAGYIAIKGDPTTVSPTMGAEEAALASMLGFENAFVAKLREIITPGHDATRCACVKCQELRTLNTGYLKYTRIKEMAIAEPAAGSSVAQVQAQKNQSKVALRMALIELIKLIF